MAGRHRLDVASNFPRYGGFAALKQEAVKANAEAREQGVELADKLRARAKAINAEIEAIYAAGTVKQPKPVPFAEALKTVLDGPHAVETPPRQ
jgi:hypothetical protein